VLLGGPAARIVRLALAAGLVLPLMMLALVLRERRGRGAGGQQECERGDFPIHSNFLCGLLTRGRKLPLRVETETVRLNRA
jgi:hypothetical protein